MRLLAIGVLSALVVACGGGGGGGESATTPVVATSTAEGIWNGTTSSGQTAAVVVLENGETWGLYASGSSIVGALYGATTSSGTAVTGSGRDFNIPTRTVGAGSYSGTYSAKSTIRLTTSGGVVFNGTYSTDYDQAASLAAVAGNFTGTGVSGNSPVQSASVAVSSSGTITVPASLGCSASGTATARPSGKNIFNVVVTFSGTTCALGNGATTQGIAYYDSTNRRIFVMAMNSAKSDGFIYVGNK